MSSNDETFRLILAIEGEEKVAQLTAAVSLAEQKYRAFQELQRAGRFDTTTVDVQREAYAKLRGELAEARTALSGVGDGGRRAGAGLGSVAGSGRNSGMALMEISRAAEDAQYGLNGVLNNLPGLVMALGGSAGLVGVVSLVAVGAYQLYKNWDTLAGVFGAGHTKTAAEEMAELAKQTRLTADEADRLGQSKALESKSKELQGGKSKEEKATESAVTDAIAEAGNAEVVRFLRAVAPEMIDSQGAAADVKGKIEAKEKQRDKLLSLAASGNDTSGQAAAQAAKLDAEIKEMTTGKGSALERARDLTAQDKVSQSALTNQFGAKPLQDMIALLEKNPDKAPAGLLEGLKGATPEGRAAKEAADAESDRVWEESQDSVKEMKESQKRARDKEKAAQSEEEKRLDIEARGNEKAYDLKVKEEEKAAKDREKLAKEDAKARMDAPGLDEFIRGELMAGASEGALGGMLKQLGFSDEEAGGLLDEGVKGALEQSIKGDGEQASSSQTLQGGAALAQAIQAGVTNAPDLAKQQLEKLAAAVTYLQRIADQRQDYTARAT